MALDLCGNIVDRIQFFTCRASENVLSAVALDAELTAKSLTIVLSSLGWSIALSHYYYKTVITSTCYSLRLKITLKKTVEIG